jgi:hypothetical protein
VAHPPQVAAKGGSKDKAVKPKDQQGQSPDLQEQANQATREKKQAQIAKQNGPALGSPEYTAELSAKVTAETDAAKKYILAPAAVVETAGLGVVVAAGAGAEAAVAAAGRAYDAGLVAAATHPEAVQAAQGAIGAATHSPFPRTFAGFAGYYGVKGADFLASHSNENIESYVP